MVVVALVPRDTFVLGLSRPLGVPSRGLPSRDAVAAASLELKAEAGK